jgi:ATP-binding cassette subfamily F protein 3
LLYEASRLTAAMDNIDDSTALLKVYRQLKYERLQRDVDEAKQRASKMSGVRGLGARKALTILEEELSAALER